MHIIQEYEEKNMSWPTYCIAEHWVWTLLLQLKVILVSKVLQSIKYCPYYLIMLPLFVMRVWSSVRRGLLFSHWMYFFHMSTCWASCGVFCGGTEGALRSRPFITVSYSWKRKGISVLNQRQKYTLLKWSLLFNPLGCYPVLSIAILWALHTNCTWKS